MEQSDGKFSIRYGLTPCRRQLIRDEAPESLRCGLLQVVHDKMAYRPRWIRDVVCRVLRVRPDPGNWSEYPNVWDEVENLVHGCNWFHFYDLIEGLYEAMRCDRRGEFEALMNSVLCEEGIGWQVVDGLVQVRGDDAFEAIVHGTSEKLKEGGLAIASGELSEALKDLSRRPEPDLSGAVQHAMAALECVARDVCGDPKATLGELVKRQPGLVPKPLDEAVTKSWGYASEQARHGREGRQLAWAEAELCVGVSAVVCSYLTQKYKIE